MFCMKKRGLAFKLIAFIVLGTGSILAAIGGYGYFCSKSILKEELVVRVKGLGELAADRFSRIALVVETVTRDIALSLAFYEPFDKNLLPLLESILSAHDEVNGLFVALPPGKEDDYSRTFVYKDGRGLHRKKLADDFDVYSKSWYSLPVSRRAPIWTDPYFGYGGSERSVISYGVPVYDLEDRLSAVVVCDLSLDWLADVMDSLNIPKGGEGFILDENGVFLAHRDRNLINTESLWPITVVAGKEAQKGIIEVGDYRGKDGWIFFRPIGDVGWSMGIFFPETAVTGSLNDLIRSQLYMALGGLLLLVLVALAISKAITGPIGSLSAATETLASGDFDFPLPHISGEDEVAQLSRSFSSMRLSLLAYIKELNDTTAARERIESELSIARSIQMSLVPRTFPPFPDRDDLDLYATLEPAREVAGDFYDFLMLDEDRILIVVGDVSGKGVPAALFMAVTRTFIRAFAKEGLSPGAILTRLNDEIARDNESCMFVTLFCAVVDILNLSLIYSSGGHPPPVLIKDRSARTLPSIKGPLVGPMEGVHFQEGEASLVPGETMFIYTDGMTDATDPSGAFLGEELPLSWLKESGGLSSEETVNLIGGRIKLFSGDAPQYDDITMLALKIKGYPETDGA